jgi:REP element-mobilizing transposase RayT
MRQPRILRDAYLHFVWATRRRLPLLAEEFEAKVYAYISQVCKDDGCDLIAVGGMPDHLHLLVNFSNKVSFAEFVQHISGKIWPSLEELPPDVDEE